MKSVSPRRIAVGLGFGCLAAGLAAFGHYRPSLPVAVAVVVLVVVIAARGLRPFGDTVAYYLLQALVFAAFGATVVVAEDSTLVAVLFTLIGVVGVVNYGWQAVRRGVWAPASG